MKNHVHNGIATRVLPTRFAVEERLEQRSSTKAIEGIRERLVDFIVQKPGTAVIAGVILGAALAILVGKRRP